jgi:formate hydrogenlyase subunit 3/multisubunit Na+/H+ antiporter MnhD subunit
MRSQPTADCSIEIRYWRALPPYSCFRWQGSLPRSAFAKYLALKAAVEAGHTELAIVGVMASLVSIFYYLRVVAVMFERREAAETDARSSLIPVTADYAMVAAVAGTIGLGILPGGFQPGHAGGRWPPGRAALSIGKR